MAGWFQRKGQAQLKGVVLDADKKTLNTTSDVVVHNKVPGSFLAFGISLLKKALHERTNQLESQPLIESGQYADIDEVLFNSEFPTLRKKAYGISFNEGQVYIIPIHFGDKYILDAWRVIRIKEKIGLFISEIELSTSTNILIDGVEIPLNATLTHKNGVSTLSKWYETQDKEGEITRHLYEDPKTYEPTTYMIGGLLRANYESMPELIYAGLDSVIPHLDYLSQEIIEESARSRTWWETNSNFSDYEGDEFAVMMKSGKPNLKADSFNQKLQSGQTPLMSGSQQQTFTQLNYSYIEDKVKEYLGIQRDSLSTGSNKHSLEITLYNQYATETLWAIRDVREHDYKIIFANLAELLDINDFDRDSIELQLSPIEKAKIDLLNETLEDKKNKGSRKGQTMEANNE